MRLPQLLRATAHAFLPVLGPIWVRHCQNFAVLNRQFPDANFDFQNARVWILSPHPDDEVLGCGGLLKRCADQKTPVKIAFLTNGDGSRTTQIAHRLRGFPAPHDLFSIAQTRQIEALSAARTLGLSEENLEFLGFPDGGNFALWNGDFSIQNPFTSPTTGKNRVEYPLSRRFGASYCRAQLVDLLRESLKEFAPTHVFTTPEIDTHLDHKIAFRALFEALQSADLKQKPQFWAFLIHYGIWPVPNGLHSQKRLAPPADLVSRFPWRSLEVSQSQLRAKIAALQTQKTQLASTPRYLHAFARRNELFFRV